VSLEYSPIIISWVRPNGYGYILTIGRGLGLHYSFSLQKLWEVERENRREGTRVREEQG